MNPSRFGSLLYKYICECELSRAELARYLALDASLITRMLKGDIGPRDRERVIKIVRWLRTKKCLMSPTQANALLEAADENPLNLDDPEEAQLLKQLSDELLPTNRAHLGPHPFGRALRPYLCREYGLTLGKLRKHTGIDVYQMIHEGKYLNRKNVTAIIAWLCTHKVLRCLKEAYKLLDAANLPRLTSTSREEAELLVRIAKPCILQCRKCLVSCKDADCCKDADTCAKMLGDIALQYRLWLGGSQDESSAETSARSLDEMAIVYQKKATRALWEAICETNDLSKIVDPCAFTVGRIVLETPSRILEDTCFDIFEKSTDRYSASIIEEFFSVILDKFAYTVKRVIFVSSEDKAKDEIQRRACRFVYNKTSSDDPLVQAKYEDVLSEVKNSYQGRAQIG